MPIALKSFIHVLRGSVTGVDPRIVLNANHVDDRIDYACDGISGGFLSRDEIDAIDSPLDLIEAAKSRARLVAILANEQS